MISVIVPAYNVGRYVGKCLRSILHQSYTDIELIVVNDCSMDDTLAVCKKVIGGGKNAILIDKTKNEGLDKARYDGVQAAHGEWIVFVDADDWLPKDALKTLHDTAVAENVDIVRGCARRCAFGGLIRWKFDISISNAKPFVRYGRNDVMRFYKRMFTYIMGVVWGTLYRTALVKRAFRLSNLLFCEDAVLTMRIMYLAESMYVVPDTVYNYRYGSGVTAGWMRDCLKLTRAFFIVMRQEAEEKHIYDEVGMDLMRQNIARLEHYVKLFIMMRPYSKGTFLAELRNELQNEWYDEMQGLVYGDKTIVECITKKDAIALYNHIESKIKECPYKTRFIYVLKGLCSNFH